MAKTEDKTLERWNSWRLYVPEAKKEMLKSFFELADRLGTSRSGAIIEAIERYYPELEEKARVQTQTDGER